MDQRETFNDLQKLKDILNKLYQEQDIVSLLLDQEGLTRMEGFITSIEEQTDPGNTLVILNDTERFLLRQVIAVNGQFRSDYSEC
jgi:transcriptional regulator of heat shock response